MDQISLHRVDVLEATLPHVLLARIRETLLFQQLRMHAHDEHFFVVGPVENPDAPPFGEALHVAPHVVVVELLVRWLLEADHLAALRIHTRHDELDRAVLAGRIHRLQHHQHGPFVLGVELVLHLGEVAPAFLQHGDAFLLVMHTIRGIRRKLAQLEVLGLAGNQEASNVHRRSLARIPSRRRLASRTGCADEARSEFATFRAVPSPFLFVIQALRRKAFGSPASP